MTEQVDFGCPLVFLLAINEVISVTVAVTGGRCPVMVEGLNQHLLSPPVNLQ